MFFAACLCSIYYSIVPVHTSQLLITTSEQINTYRANIYTNKQKQKANSLT